MTEYLDVEAFWRRVDKSASCWHWIGSRTQLQYGFMAAKVNGKWKNLAAHRASYSLQYGKIPPGLCVCHRCDTPSCVRPDHLFLGTKKDNTQDMMAKGRHGCEYGENTRLAKLTVQQVKEIKRRYVRGKVYQRDLAAEFGVHVATISRIVLGKNWGRVLGDASRVNSNA